MKYSKVVFTISKNDILVMDVRGLEWTQILRRVDNVNRYCHLRMRKVPRKPLYMLRIGGRWINHTRAEII